MRSALLALALGAALLNTGCSDSTLNQIAKFEADLHAADATGFQVVSTAAAQNPPLISQADATAIVQILLRVEQADNQAVMATQQIQTLSAANQANLLNVLQPIQTAINNSVQNGTLGIQDAATKTKVQNVLVTIQTIVNAGVSLIQAAKTQ